MILITSPEPSEKVGISQIEVVYNHVLYPQKSIHNFVHMLMHILISLLTNRIFIRILGSNRR
jgi:hypothetical protein